jgi:hypothetical protein
MSKQDQEEPNKKSTIEDLTVDEVSSQNVNGGGALGDGSVRVVRESITSTQW